MRLTHLIKYYGDKVLDLENGIDLFERVQRKDAGAEDVIRSFENAGRIYEDFKDLRSKEDFKVPFTDEILKSDEYSSFLGLAILNHDLGTFCGASMGGSHYLSLVLSDESQEKEILDEKSYFYYNDIFRKGLSMIPYVATGDTKYLDNIDADSFPEYLRHATCKKLDLKCNLGDNKPVDSDIFFSMTQLAKNARKNLYSSMKKHETDETVNVKFREGHLYNVFSVSDNGTGISPDDLPKIFGNYTTKGTGIGLQVVKRVMDLRKGYVGVTSTQEGGDSFRYDTMSDFFTRIDDKKPRGTTFKLYVPRSIG